MPRPRRSMAATASAVRGRRPGRSSDLALCRDQAGRRAADGDLRPSAQAAGDRPALLHGLRPVGPARHGAVHLRQGDPRRQHRSSSSTWASLEARLQLHRRHRGRHAGRARQAGRRARPPALQSRRRRAARTSPDVIELFEKAFGKKASDRAAARRARRHAGDLRRYHRHDRGISTGARKSRWKRACRSS